METQTQPKAEEEKKETKSDVNLLLVVGICTFVAGALVAYLIIATTAPIAPFATVAVGTPQQQPSVSELEQKVKEYIDTNFLGPYGGKSKILNRTEYGNLVEFVIEVEAQGQVSRGNAYATTDGKYILFGTLLDITKPLELPQIQPQQTAQPAIDRGELVKFINCLHAAGVKIYGANWCGWTLRLVEMLGGFDVVAPIYIECTEQEEICNAENIQGYPTIKINGTEYHGRRTFADLARATGCPIPKGAEAEAPQQNPNPGAVCPQ